MGRNDVKGEEKYPIIGPQRTGPGGPGRTGDEQEDSGLIGV